MEAKKDRMQLPVPGILYLPSHAQPEERSASCCFAAKQHELKHSNAS